MSVSRGVLVTMAISCSRIGFAVDCKIWKVMCIAFVNWTHFEIIERINELCIDIGTSPSVSRLGIHDI